MTARATIFGPEGLELTPWEQAFFRDSDPWGFILFKRNLDTPDQIRKLTTQLREAVGRNAPILIDQEGGRVARLEPPHWQGWSPALHYADGHPDRARAFWLRSRIMAAELLALGIDVNCAPLADIATPQTHPFLKNRCYGTSVDTVTEMGRAVADGLLAGGVAPILKHIPGHGRAAGDSHLSLPRVDVSAETLRDVDFAPFRALNDLPMAMTAHLVYDAFDADRCATLSPTMIGLIRDEIGFDGLLMTDDLSMHALGGPFAARVAGSLDAGCDMILHCNADRAEMLEIAEATPRLAGDAARRADAAAAARATPQPFDFATALAEVTALMEVRDAG
ncbi:beta-N-acetylhexosaminidase [Rubricella aquisinus]|uniref:beta-N-acetylhexosaminidase n=1 Tax=Rubricella aquisinus TaxID=2028108 RepID=A0A840X6M8_9RHOB|nr:glycoside hydrolase family 3 protein [Rubricella aquisinus]MBB5516357.1 beta-N-acetylhexosaminidase [Rubricella aquisinus]